MITLVLVVADCILGNESEWNGLNDNFELKWKATILIISTLYIISGVRQSHFKPNPDCYSDSLNYINRIGTELTNRRLETPWPSGQKKRGDEWFTIYLDWLFFPAPAWSTINRGSSDLLQIRRKPDKVVEFCSNRYFVYIIMWTFPTEFSRAKFIFFIRMADRGPEISNWTQILKTYAQKSWKHMSYGYHQTVSWPHKAMHPFVIEPVNI